MKPIRSRRAFFATTTSRVTAWPVAIAADVDPGHRLFDAGAAGHGARPGRKRPGIHGLAAPAGVAPSGSRPGRAGTHAKKTPPGGRRQACMLGKRAGALQGPPASFF
jgi:hypothetical protein